MGDRPEDELPDADDQAPRRPRPRPQAAAARPAGGQRSARPTRQTTGSARSTAERPRRAAPAPPPPRRQPAPRARRPAQPRPAQPRPGQRPAQPRSAQSRPEAQPRPPATRPPGRRPPPSTPPAKSQTTMIIVLSGISVVVVLLLIGAFLIPTGGGDPQSGQTSQTTDPTALGTTVPDAQLTSFKDDATGFSVKYPKAWAKVESSDPSIPLILSFGNRDACTSAWTTPRCRRTPRTSATSRRSPTASSASNQTAKVLQQRQVAVDNMPGYYYLYTFVDEETGAEGVHAHYFLFRGRKMYSVVLQALPSEGFPAWPRRSTRSSRASRRRPTCPGRPPRHRRRLPRRRRADRQHGPNPTNW